MQRYFDVVQNRQGTAVVGATVTVYDANGNLATLYSNNSGAASSNPVYTNSDGEYAFYAANGTYSITIAQAGYATETKPGVVLFDPSDSSASNNVQFLQAGTGAQVRSVQSKLRDVVSVKDFGAVGDGVADDTAAIQAAIDAANPVGAAVYVPHGNYYITSTLSIDNSGDTADTYKATIFGDSPSAAKIIGGVGAFNMLNVIGGTGAGLHSHQVIRGLFLQKTDNFGSVISIDNAAFFLLDAVHVLGGQFAIYGTDVLSSVMNACVFRFADSGLRFEYGNASRPNAITLVGCVIGNNKNYGALISDGTTFNMVGGSLENNGVDGTAATKYGLMFSNSGVEGALSANLLGVYIEGNKGTADVWFANSAQSTAASINGCSFARVSSTDFTTNNIYVETSGSGVVQTVSVSGCGFKALGSYTPSFARKYINATATNGGKNEVSWSGCLFDSSIEKPTISNGNIIRDSGNNYYSADIAVVGNYADDTAAAAAGIPVGGLYRTGSTIKIRAA